jgi:hypothetical protein
MMIPEITIPPIDIPFAPSPKNPLEGQLYLPALEWARSFHLVTTEAAERFRRYHIDRLVSYFAPTVDDWTALRLFSDWMTWAILFEDQIDEATAGLRPDLLASVLDEFRAILFHDTSIQARPSPAAAALAELWQRTLMRMLVRGNHDWHMHAERYRHGADVAENLHSLEDLFGATHDDTKGPTAS